MKLEVRGGPTELSRKFGFITISNDEFNSRQVRLKRKIPPLEMEGIFDILMIGSEYFISLNSDQRKTYLFNNS